GGSCRHRRGGHPPGKEEERGRQEDPRGRPGLLRRPSPVRLSSPRKSPSPKGESRMRTLVRVALMLLVSGMTLPFAGPAAGQAPSAGTTVIKAARVFTSTSERPLAPGMVIVEGDHITQVGTNLAVPPGARVIDLGDSTLLPGFIDAHVHMSGESSDDWYRDFYQNALRFPA